MQIKDRKIKLLYPPEYIEKNIQGKIMAPSFPYGMNIVYAILKENFQFVEQDDLWFKNNILRKNLNNKLIVGSNFPQKCLKEGIKDLTLNNLVKEILTSTNYHGFNIFGFSILSYPQFIIALLLAEKIKQDTGAVIVFGGAFIKLQGHLFFDKYKFIDYMMQGDGDGLVELIKNLDDFAILNRIPGLIFRKFKTIKIIPKNKTNINNVPLPNFSGLPLLEDARIFSRFKDKIYLPYQISRGCAYGNCTYCAIPKIETFQCKKIDKVTKELKEYSDKYKIKKIWFLDSAINFSYKYLEALCEAFIGNSSPYSWKAWAKIGGMNEGILRKMKQSGCSDLFWGIESGSEKILSYIHKGFIPEVATDILKKSNELGINNHIGLMVGLPHERQDDVLKTAHFLKNNKNYIKSISINKFSLEYNTYIYNHPQKNQIHNIVPNLETGHRNHFAFDEIGGLKWSLKKKQQKKHFFYLAEYWKNLKLPMNC